MKRINKACRENGRRQRSSRDVAVRDGVLGDSWNASRSPFHDIFCRVVHVTTRKRRYYYAFKTKQKWIAGKCSRIQVIIVIFLFSKMNRARQWCVDIVLYRFIAAFWVSSVSYFNSNTIYETIDSYMSLTNIFLKGDQEVIVMTKVSAINKFKVVKLVSA